MTMEMDLVNGDCNDVFEGDAQEEDVHVEVGAAALRGRQAEDTWMRTRQALPTGGEDGDGDEEEDGDGDDDEDDNDDDEEDFDDNHVVVPRAADAMVAKWTVPTGASR